jgi:hypothetical protein
MEVDWCVRAMWRVEVTWLWREEDGMEMSFRKLRLFLVGRVRCFAFSRTFNFCSLVDKFSPKTSSEARSGALIPWVLNVLSKARGLDSSSKLVGVRRYQLLLERFFILRRSWIEQARNWIVETLEVVSARCFNRFWAQRLNRVNQESRASPISNVEKGGVLTGVDRVFRALTIGMTAGNALRHALNGAEG